MLLTLNVYKDESMREVKRVCEADGVKIPYRVSMALLSTLDTIDISNQDDLIKFIAQNVEKVDKILKATFGISELELDCIDSVELVEVIKQLINWVVDNMSRLGAVDSKNE